MRKHPPQATKFTSLLALSLLLSGCPSSKSESQARESSAGPSPAKAQHEGLEADDAEAPPTKEKGPASKDQPPASPKSAAGSKKEGAGAEAPPFEGTADMTEKKVEVGSQLLKSVRAAEHPGFDRVVFEFEGGLPGHHIEYIDRPIRDCGAGHVLPVAGDGWLQVRMYPAQAHTEAGEPTISSREIATELPNVLELQRTCDFEGQVTYVLGTGSPNRYRVLELKSPPRLVVDVLHHN